MILESAAGIFKKNYHTFLVYSALDSRAFLGIYITPCNDVNLTGAVKLTGFGAHM